jgi:hypothetical protein
MLTVQVARTKLVEISQQSSNEGRDDINNGNVDENLDTAIT